MSSNRDKLDALAQALLDHETLDQDEAYAVAGVGMPSERPVPRPSGEARQVEHVG
jgi:cell division protease FtsH